jgi:hypothetical protein
VIAILQRVREARVEVGGTVVGAIGQGLLMLVCAEPTDSEATAEKLVAKVLKLRVFSDAAGKMNRSVQDVGGAGRASPEPHRRISAGGSTSTRSPSREASIRSSPAASSAPTCRYTSSTTGP